MAENKFEVRVNGNVVHETENPARRVISLEVNTSRGQVTKVGVEDIDYVDIIVHTLSNLNGPSLQDVDHEAREERRRWATENTLSSSESVKSASGATETATEVTETEESETEEPETEESEHGKPLDLPGRFGQ